jgi:hypothetical protein
MTRKPADLITKDPLSDEPQGFDWTAWLLELGVGITLATSVWVITGADALLTQHDASLAGGNLKTQVYLAGGTPGVKYTVANHVTTTATLPVPDSRSFTVLVQTR